MTIRDPFSYSDRWDSVGLDCCQCVHFAGPEKWPDIQRISHCSMHKISLSVELARSGYKSGEWFCKDFKDDGKGRTSLKALQEFNAVKDQLEPLKLYGAYGENGNLKEYNFNDLPTKRTD